MLRFLLIVSSMGFIGTVAFAADLTKVERKIAKEPAYKGKPKYCLLVFGQDAKHRVWLVQDGDVLYVDRNGNGDLTEPGERIAAEKREAGVDYLTFKVPDIRLGGRVHRDLSVMFMKLDYLAELDTRIKALVAKNPEFRGYMFNIEIESARWKGTGIGGRVLQTVAPFDIHGVLQFADQAKDAPIIHFDGPLSITLFSEHHLRIGRETDVMLGVGSPGRGAGTFAYIAYESVIPETAYPTLEIIYPSKNSGEPPFRAKHELKQRC